MLGRPFKVRGIVERGDQRGRELGYPTANLRLTPRQAEILDFLRRHRDEQGVPPTRAEIVAALRSIVHALRGWPTPFAAAVNSAQTKFDADGGASDPAVVEQLRLVGRQVARFAPARNLAPSFTDA